MESKVNEDDAMQIIIVCRGSLVYSSFSLRYFLSVFPLSALLAYPKSFFLYCITIKHSK